MTVDAMTRADQIPIRRDSVLSALSDLAALIPDCSDPKPLLGKAMTCLERDAMAYIGGCPGCRMRFDALSAVRSVGRVVDLLEKAR